MCDGAVQFDPATYSPVYAALQGVTAEKFDRIGRRKGTNWDLEVCKSMSVQL